MNATDQSDFGGIGVGTAANADDYICPAYDIGVQTEALLQAKTDWLSCSWSTKSSTSVYGVCAFTPVILPLQFHAPRESYFYSPTFLATTRFPSIISNF